MIPTVNPGDPARLSARSWNAFVATANAYQAGQLGPRPGPYAAGSPIILILNDTEDDIDRGQILGLDGPVHSYTDNPDAWISQLCWRGVTPAAEHRGRWALALAPIAAGEIGKAALAGIFAVPIYRVKTEHFLADIDVGSSAPCYDLTSGLCGAAEILWTEDDFDDTPTNGIVRIGAWHSLKLAATAAEDIDPDGSGDVTVTTTGETLTAELRYLHGDWAITDGTEILIEYFRDLAAWIITGAAC